MRTQFMAVRFFIRLGDDVWITADVDLPDSLLDAQQESRLVVFAGAGISVDAPSAMPSFPRLVTMLATEAGEEAPDWGAVPSDAFLGGLERDGFNVHERVAALLTPSRGQVPNSYHEALLGLFRDAQSVRIVTTNHDPFLTIAATEFFGEAVESYYAPALPVGDEFAGVVYLHGGVARNATRLVLTNGDFGRAYLTQAWATTFLRAMYSRFDVVFIGYSHGEPVLRYLASGLSAATRRFAFDPHDGDDAAWQTIGITRIPYPRSAEPSEHAALREAIAAWSERTTMGYLDHEARIRDAVSGPPPLDVAQADYLRQMLGDAATARFFATYAALPEWLGWAKDLPQFRALFGLSEIQPASLELAQWFARAMILAHAEAALSVLQELGGRMTPDLWFACAHQLWTADPRPAPHVFAKWVSTLIESTPAVEGDTYLGYLLDSCRWPDDRSVALLLFAHLTDPHPEFEQRMAMLGDNEPGVRVSVAIRGDADQLRESWNNYFRPRVSELAEQLEPILAGQLVRAHEILKAAGEANDTWDPTSYLLPRIEAPDDA
jgi:hypothetical protein